MKRRKARPAVADLKPLRIKYPINDEGRDFVIGDLHGCYMRLQQLMEHVGFDKGKDRMFSVGDLVDRGPHNEDCLRLLTCPWFHPVQGNHEQMMVAYFADQPTGYFWEQNGGSWGIRYKGSTNGDAQEIHALIKKAAELPLMATVEMKDGKRFHVLHAELSLVRPISDEDLDDPELFSDIAMSEKEDGAAIVWGRETFGALYGRTVTDALRRSMKAIVQQVERCAGDAFSSVYCGHTILRQPTTIGNRTNIDTGGFLSYDRPRMPAEDWAGLTMAAPLTGEFWIANDKGVTETRPLLLAS